MPRSSKISRNDLCPCGTGRKYKRCCEPRLDWNEVFRSKCDWRQYLSIRGRNLYFAKSIANILQLEAPGSVLSPARFKAAFTAAAVQQIHEKVMEAWPPTLDIHAALSGASADVSGLYIGDYGLEYITRGIVRHSIYANKILVVDPFVYPTSVRDEYNPIINPEQYRAQTLKNVNFWFSFLPWIEAGLVEIIRTPSDFDRRLNWESMERQYQKFETNEVLKKAAEESVQELKKRHMNNASFHHLILSAPDSHLLSLFEDLKLEKDGFSAEDFLDYVHRQREADINFLEPLGPDSKSGQLHMMSTGSSYEIAKLTASLTGSYLVTDLAVKWREIEIDRESHSTENKAWAPFAKAVQDVSLHYFDRLHLEHALLLRKEGRLEPLRAFLRRVWKDACLGDPFDEGNARILADELIAEVKAAEQEWKQIDCDLLKIIGAEASAGILAGGPLIASGQAAFLAAGVFIAGVATLASTTAQRRGFQDKFPAAFFMKLK